jgi:hypothetical protein
LVCNNREQPKKGGLYMKKRAYICMYQSYRDIFKLLSNEKVGQLVKDMMQYAEDGTAPEYGDELIYLWPVFQSQMDRDMEKYDKRCQLNRENGKKGGRPKSEDAPEEYWSSSLKNRMVF